MEPKKLIPPESPKDQIRVLEENLRIESRKKIPTLEAERMIFEYLDKVWNDYGKLEDNWSNETAPDPYGYVNISRTIKLRIQVDYDEGLSIFDFWKAQYIPKNVWYWTEGTITNPIDELKEIIERYQEPKDNEAVKFFGTILTHENFKNVIVDMFYNPKVHGMLFTVIKSNECIKSEDEPFVKSYPYKNIKIRKEDNDRVSYEEFLTDLQDKRSPWRLGDPLKYDIVVKKLAKDEEL